MQASSSRRTPAFACLATLTILLASACATDPKEINGHKVIGSHIVNGRRIYETASDESDEQSMADTLARMKADTDSYVIPPVSPTPKPADQASPATQPQPAASSLTQTDSWQTSEQATPSSNR